MKRRMTYSKLMSFALCASLSMFAAVGMECPPPGDEPTIPDVLPGNRAPRLIITAVSTPEGNMTAEQGDLVTIDFTGEDSEDRANVSVFASTSINPDTGTMLPILVNFPVGPGEASGTAFWPTNAVAPGTYFIFGTIDDGTFDSATGEGNPPIRVTNGEPILITAPGVGEENAPPEVEVQLPSSDVGLTNNDILTVRFSPNDPDIGEEVLTARIFFDTDRNPNNDASNPPIEVVDPILLDATDFDPVTDPDVDVEITINLNEIPINRETDEFGRSLPYFVRVEISDGEAEPVSDYAVGTVSILAAPSDVVDIRQLGRVIAGAVWQGFDGNPIDPALGSRTGSSFASLGDVDGDGLAEFAIVSESASPNGNARVGEVAVVYGRERRLSQNLVGILPFGTGRYAGVNSINTIGSFVPFPPTDPRYRQFFNTRGHQIAMQGAGTTTFGVTSVARMDDITFDGTEELLIGFPLGSNMNDEEDLDPCDTCQVDEEVRAPITCFETIFRPSGADDALEADVERLSNNPLDSQSDGTIAANSWAPFDPAGGNAAIPFNVDFELDSNQRILDYGSLTLTIEGCRQDEMDVNFSIEIQLENQFGPSQVIPIQGPQFAASNMGGGGMDEEDGCFVTTFNYMVENLPVAAGEALPPSMFDGQFLMFVRPSAGVEEFAITATAAASIANPLEDRPFKTAYPNDSTVNTNSIYPPVFSDTGSIEAGLNPFIFETLGIACPPRNRSVNPLSLPNFGAEDGRFCFELDVPGATIGCFDNEGDEDGLNEEQYTSGLVYVDAFDDMLLTLDTDGSFNEGAGGRILPNQIVFGQPDTPRLRGARFRGAWYQPEQIYDPLSLYGYTVDAMPNFDDDNFETSTIEMLVSAPGGGEFFQTTPFSLTTDLGGTYSNDPGDISAVTSLSADFDFGLQFGNVTDIAALVIGTAQNGAVMQVGLADPVSGEFIPGTVREVLLWGGAAPAADEDEAPFLPPGSLIGDQVNFAVNVPLPAAARPLLLNSAGTLRIDIRDDCAVRFSSFDLLEASVAMEGLLIDAGYVLVYEGANYTSNIIEDFFCAGSTDGDAESGDDRPMSWPSFRCTSDQTTRAPCGPPTITLIEGESAGDALGFARFAGDLNLDGVADFALGAPGNDNDPVNPFLDCSPELAPLDNNGKAYIIFGTPFLTPVAPNGPCDIPERVEIRGSHNGDQFGRLQGAAGDVNNDGNTDIYVGAEFYDLTNSSTDPVGGLPGFNPLPDAGFVGILFGGGIDQNGALSIRPERIGSQNFPGCIFVGGSAGARLGGGTPGNTTRIAGQGGQHGVNNAGDFNRDGADDLLITAPGQEWPAAQIEFFGPVSDGDTVTINGGMRLADDGVTLVPIIVTFEFNLTGGVANGNVPVPVALDTAEAAQRALIDVLTSFDAEEIGVSSIVARNNFPAPLPDTPTITFLRRTYTANAGWAVDTGANIVTTESRRQGVAYLVFGDEELLSGNIFQLPQDLNRRNNQGQRVLRGIVFVSAFDKNTGMADSTPDEAPIEAVSLAGDVDGDGFVDILLGAPQADLINVVAPNERRQSAGEAYLIYGNAFGLNSPLRP